MNVGLAMGLIIISLVGMYASLTGKLGSVLASLFAPELLMGPVIGGTTNVGSFPAANAASYSSTSSNQLVGASGITTTGPIT